MINYIPHLIEAQIKMGSWTKICPMYTEVKHRRVQIVCFGEKVLQRYLKNSAKFY